VSGNCKVLENEQDWQNEIRIAEYLEFAWQCEMEKQPKFSTFDYIAKRGNEVMAFVEIRCLNNAFDRYACSYINLKKLLEARLLESATQTKCLFVVEFTDCLAFCRLNKKLRLVKSLATWKRRNPDELDEIAMIPMRQFQKIHYAVPRSLSQASR